MKTLGNAIVKSSATKPINTVGGNNEGVMAKDIKAKNFVGRDNYGKVGDEYTGIKQRHVSDETVSFITKNFPDKNTWLFFSVPPNDQEAFKYMAEIANRIVRQGYVRVDRSSGTYLGGGGKPLGGGLTTSEVISGQMTIYIPPAPNIDR